MRKIHLVKQSACLPVPMRIDADHIDLARARILVSPEKWDLAAILRKWDLLLQQKLCCPVGHTHIRCPAKLNVVACKVA